jgi:hypothetical protein
MEKETTIEGVIEIIMNSDPMKRVLSLEQSSIITGRAPQYKGVTIQEVIRQALSAQKEEIEAAFLNQKSNVHDQAVREQVGRDINEVLEKEKKPLSEYPSNIQPQFVHGRNSAIVDIQSIVSSITSNKEKK